MSLEARSIVEKSVGSRALGSSRLLSESRTASIVQGWEKPDFFPREIGFKVLMNKTRFWLIKP
jgi:hypothetical protein